MLQKTTQPLKHYYQHIISAVLITILILIIYGARDIGYSEFTWACTENPPS